MSPKRSVEMDYRFYDPPEAIWKKLTENKILYTRDRDKLNKRDLALMSVLYISTSRVSEIVRAQVKGGFSPSIRKYQFVKMGDFLYLRNLEVFKRFKVESLEDYPSRVEIPFPLKGYLARFTQSIIDYLDYFEREDLEVFPITTTRAYQIVNGITREFPHYLREMGLKFWLRIYSRDIVKLKDFSGHARIENLVRYLRDLAEEDKLKLLEYGV